MNSTQFSFIHIGAENWQELSSFYAASLDFVESDRKDCLFGREGIVMSVPGFEAPLSAPAVAFYKAEGGSSSKINDTGFAHLCFETTDVKGAVKRFVKCGGTLLSTIKNPEIQPCVYCLDPEGNVVEFHVPFPSDGGFGEYLTLAGSILGLKPDSHLRKGSTRKTSLKFIHVNIICPDWEDTCRFYCDTFDCTSFGKLKDHSGSYKEQIISVPGVHVIGHHILLPGFTGREPTLEIFTYSVKGREIPAGENMKGINCIGFTCSDRKETAARLVASGGSVIRETEEYILSADTNGGLIVLV